MCDILKRERKKRYKQLRKIGHTAAWARRARDFSKNHYEFHANTPPNMDVIL